MLKSCRSYQAFFRLRAYNFGDFLTFYSMTSFTVTIYIVRKVREEFNHFPLCENALAVTHQPPPVKAWYVSSVETLMASSLTQKKGWGGCQNLWKWLSAIEVSCFWSFSLVTTYAPTDRTGDITYHDKYNWKWNEEVKRSEHGGLGKTNKKSVNPELWKNLCFHHCNDFSMPGGNF